jgi:hypothetical protein
LILVTRRLRSNKALRIYSFRAEKLLDLLDFGIFGPAVEYPSIAGRQNNGDGAGDGVLQENNHSAG